VKAILVDAPGGRLALHDAPDPVPAPHGAVVEVRATGVCRSDWHAWMGHDPTVAFPSGRSAARCTPSARASA
jgi:alcohol dehydrogenase